MMQLNVDFGEVIAMDIPLKSTRSEIGLQVATCLLSFPMCLLRHGLKPLLALSESEYSIEESFVQKRFRLVVG